MQGHQHFLPFAAKMAGPRITDGADIRTLEKVSSLAITCPSI